ncbi:MAG: prepilin-type N-terminal cleavage/methylation domain-containing protein [Candidatus Omnitrophota bacterium]
MEARMERQKGFTLVEVLISLCIFLVVCLSFASALVTSMYLSSYMKHRVQAMYWAQRILEEERRIPFNNIVSQPSSPISLDTRGTFTVTGDDFIGNRIITVTNVDMAVTNMYRKKVQVEVNWTERILGGNVQRQENCSTDIANESQII